MSIASTLRSRGGAVDGRNRRTAVRVSSGLDSSLPSRAEFIVGDTKDSGWIPNISVCGALVSETSYCPEVGAEVDLYFHGEASDRRLHAIGQVVRQLDSGFAVLFLWLEAELRQVVHAAVEKGGEEAASQLRVH